MIEKTGCKCEPYFKGQEFIVHYTLYLTHFNGPLVGCSRCWDFNSHKLWGWVTECHVCDEWVLACLAGSYESEGHEQTLLVQMTLTTWITHVPDLSRK